MMNLIFDGVKVNLGYRNREWLWQKYIVEGLSSRQIARLCNLREKKTVLYWLKKHSIQARTMGDAQLLRFSRDEEREKIRRAALKQYYGSFLNRLKLAAKDSIKACRKYF